MTRKMANWNNFQFTRGSRSEEISNNVIGMSPKCHDDDAIHHVDPDIYSYIVAASGCLFLGLLWVGPRDKDVLLVWVFSLDFLIITNMYFTSHSHSTAFCHTPQCHIQRHKHEKVHVLKSI